MLAWAKYRCRAALAGFAVLAEGLLLLLTSMDSEEEVVSSCSWYCWMRRYQSCGTKGDARRDDKDIVVAAVVVVDREVGVGGVVAVMGRRVSSLAAAVGTWGTRVFTRDLHRGQSISPEAREDNTQMMRREGKA